MKTVNGVPEFKVSPSSASLPSVRLPSFLIPPTLQGAMDVLRQVVRREGVLALWTGFLPYFARLGPHTVLTFMILEQLNGAYRTFGASR